jgi:hypothetical protein
MYDNTRYVTCLVTAKHILQPAKGDFYSEIYLSLNTHENVAALDKLPLKSNNVLTHQDESVDIVHVPCRVDKNKYGFGNKIVIIVVGFVSVRNLRKNSYPMILTR